MSDWTYPPSEDEEIQASRDATGQMFMAFKAGFYTGWHTSMNAQHKMPRAETKNFAPPPAQANQANNVRYVAFMISQLIEGDEDIINLNHPNVSEMTKAAWDAAQPVEELEPV